MQDNARLADSRVARADESFGQRTHLDAAELAVGASESRFSMRLALPDDDGFGRVIPAGFGRPLRHAPMAARDGRGESGVPTERGLRLMGESVPGRDKTGQEMAWLASVGDQRRGKRSGSESVVDRDRLPKRKRKRSSLRWDPDGSIQVMGGSALNPWMEQRGCGDDNRGNETERARVAPQNAIFNVRVQCDRRR